MGILFRTFLDSLSPHLLLTSFLASCILEFYPLSSFFDFVFLFYPSSSLYLRFCVSILFRTFLGFWIFSLFLLFHSLSSVLLRSFFLCKLLGFCVGILSRTFLDSTFHLLLQFLFNFSSNFIIRVLKRCLPFSSSPFYTILSFLNSSTILRGHIVPHFLGRTHSFFTSIFSPLTLTSLIFFHSPTFFFRFCYFLVTLRGHIVPHFHKIPPISHLGNFFPVCLALLPAPKFVLLCFLLPVISKLLTLRSKNLVSLS